MKRLNYGLVVFATTPFACLAIVAGLFEVALGTDGEATLWLSGPFRWAIDRKV
jgi:hypothetical protein